MTQPTLMITEISPVLANSSVPTSPSAAEQANLERRARRWWVSAIVGLLGLQVVVGVGSVLLAVGDPTVAIVPNYHQKALDWDASQRAAHLTEKLGWEVVPLVSLTSPETGKRLVRVAIRDRSDQPVSDLNLSAKVYHHARGSEVYELTFVETDAGYYEAMTSLVQPGMWQVSLQIEGNHGIASDTREMTVE
ncbi:MAG: FixH family protein [Planctomycetales bacterium]|nr:FixH family protein [Planctomycetales bacterium]